MLLPKGLNQQKGGLGMGWWSLLKSNKIPNFRNMSNSHSKEDKSFSEGRIKNPNYIAYLTCVTPNWQQWYFCHRGLHQDGWETGNDYYCCCSSRASWPFWFETLKSHTSLIYVTAIDHGGHSACRSGLTLPVRVDWSTNQANPFNLLCIAAT